MRTALQQLEAAMADQRSISIQAERERCAQMAEHVALQWVNGEATTLYGQAYQAACRNVAAAIRGQALPYIASDVAADPVTTAQQGEK